MPVGRGWIALALTLLVLTPRPAPGAPDVNAIQGQVIWKEHGPLADAVVLLQDETGSLVAVTPTDAAGQYHFDMLTTGVYRVVAADPAGSLDADAVPGPHAARIDSSTLQVTMVSGVTQYPRNDFVKSLAQAPSPRIERLLTLGDTVAAPAPSGFSAIEPLDLDPDGSMIRRAADDGSLFVLDPAGTALFRLTASRSEVLLDTTGRDPIDRVALTRLTRVETGRDGTSAVLAQRADDTRGIYRLEPGKLTRLALIRDPSDPEELAIGDAGQIAYVARSASGAMTLYQALPGGQPVELLRQGQELVKGAAVKDFGINDLTSNGAGDLAFSADLRPASGDESRAVVRRTRAGLEVVAVTGQLVQVGRGAGNASGLDELLRPRIGPDGTVIFQGITDDLANFFVARPGRPLQPALPIDLTQRWQRDPAAFAYDIGADGTVALRATRLTASQSDLFLLFPNGDLSLIAGAAREIHVQPVGQPVFGPGGLLFFQAKNPDWPFDRNGRIAAGLFRYRPGEASPVPVAVPGQPVPGRPGAQLLGTPQRPAVSAREVAFAALFGGTERFPVPTAALFRVPLGGTVEKDGTLVATEGAELSFPAQVVAFRDFYYTADGTLLIDSFVRKGLAVGQLLATVGPRATTASAVRTQATPPAAPVPLLVRGDALGSGRKLERVLGRLVAFGTGRWLFAAEFTRDASAGEGLFLTDRDKQIQAVAVTGDPAAGPGLAGGRFIAFGETPKEGDSRSYTPYAPAVSADGSIAFKARLERSGTATAGVFQWRGAAPIAAALSDPSPDDLARSPEDRPPYDLQRWAAGINGLTYLLERHQTRAGGLVTRLFERSAAGLRPLVETGGNGSLSPLADLTDFVVNQAGELFVQASVAGAPAVLAVRPAGLAPLAVRGQALPPMADGTRLPGLVFTGSFTLAPESSRGPLYFTGRVARPAGPSPSRRGLFRLGPQGLETVLVEGVAVQGARNVSIVVIAGVSNRQRGSQLGTLSAAQAPQELNGVTAFARRTSEGGWAIYRSRAARDPRTGKAAISIVLIAREGQELPDGTSFASLDPSILLGRPIDSGPVFTVSATGDVAFLVSDGLRWSLYRFTDRF